MRILHIINDLATGGTEHLLVKSVRHHPPVKIVRFASEAGIPESRRTVVLTEELAIILQRMRRLTIRALDR